MIDALHYTREVGRKFHADGSARLFPGNTIICFLDLKSPLAQEAMAFQADLMIQPYGPKFAMLPPSSYHMTVMELLCFEIRQADRWSAELALDATASETDNFFIKRVPPVPAPEPTGMQVDGLYTRDNIFLTLQPAQPGGDRELRAYRDAVAEATSVRFPNHESYGFHISLAYRLIELTAVEESAFQHFCTNWLHKLKAAGQEIRLGPPTLTFFDDMLRFVPEGQRPGLASRGVTGDKMKR